MNGPATPRTSRVALVVDDDTSLRLMLRARLAQEGMEVVEAPDGEAGLAAFDAHQPDLVLLDVVMPRLDGFEACRRLRARAQGRHTPILMLTSLDDSASVDHAFEAGATDFLPKPIQWSMFGHRIRYILRASEAVDALATSRERLAKSQRVARLASWEWDAATRHLLRSEAADEITGLSAEAFPKTLEEVLQYVHPDDRERVQRASADWWRPEEPEPMEYRVVRPDGAVRHMAVQVERDFDAKGRLARLHGIVQDITDRKQAEARIRHLAYVDTVTGLPNRAAALEHLGLTIEEARRSGRTMAVLFLDLDHFKRINDTMGHSAGDATLHAVGRRLDRILRQRRTSGGGDAGTAIGRLGGDEFCVTLCDIGSAQEAAAVAKRLLEAFREPFSVDGRESYLSASIGVALYPQDGNDAETLLRSADAAMYQAKDDGRGVLQFYSPSLNQRALDRLTLENELRRAVEFGEFTLHYQPQVHGATRRLVGMEALVRWRHPTRGLVLPGHFVPTAEECRLIVRIDDWVMREACRQNRAWQLAGLPIVPVSVNLSGHHFSRESLIDDVARALADSGLDAQFLTLEITEGVLMSEHSKVAANLRRLRQMGVRLALDDFGTGYSSLSYLKRLPLDELKIDRSFARDIATDADSAAIVRAIVAIGETLGLNLIAEGVETEGQADCLRLQGCNAMQGYLFGRPQDPEAIRELLAGTTGLDIDGSQAVLRLATALERR